MLDVRAVSCNAIAIALSGWTFTNMLICSNAFIFLLHLNTSLITYLGKCLAWTKSHTPVTWRLWSRVYWTERPSGQLSWPSQVLLTDWPLRPPTPYTTSVAVYTHLLLKQSCNKTQIDKVNNIFRTHSPVMRFYRFLENLTLMTMWTVTKLSVPCADVHFSCATWQLTAI